MELKKQSLRVESVKTKVNGEFPVGMIYLKQFSNGIVLSRYVWMNYAVRPKKGDVVEGFKDITFKTNKKGFEHVIDMTW